VDAVLVAQNGKLLLDEYFYLAERERIHSLQSCTKSVRSLLIGIAKDGGLIQNLNAPLTAFFWAYKKSMEEKFPQPTLRNALTMPAGLDWHEDIPYKMSQARTGDTVINGGGVYCVLKRRRIP